MSRPRVLPLALLLMASACDPTTLEPHRVDAALSLSTGGAVDTDFPVADLQGPRTLSVRFMLKYPNSYYNALIGESGNTGLLFIGKDSSLSNGEDVPHLAVHFGGVSGTFLLPGTNQGLEAARWYHLVITVDAERKLRLYLDGVAATPQQQALQLPATPWAAGNLRFGQRNSLMTMPEQFYGLMDDVSIWNGVLTEAEISSLAQNPKLSGSEPNLLAGWNFDVLVGGAQPLPKHDNALTYGTKGATLAVPTAVKSFADLLVTANHDTPLGLPVNGAWRVVQGSDSPPLKESHRGYASFCMDLVLADGSSSRGKDVYAAADGKVVFIRDTSPDAVPNQKVPGCTECVADDGSCGYISNQVTLEHTGDELTEYIHLQPNSVPQSIKDKLLSGALVKKGELLGKVGKSGTGGDHLHFSLLWRNVLTQGDNGSSPASTSRRRAVATPPRCSRPPCSPGPSSSPTTRFRRPAPGPSRTPRGRRREWVTCSRTEKGKGPPVLGRSTRRARGLHASRRFSSGRCPA